MKPSLNAVLFSVLFVPSLYIYADEPARRQWVMDESYNGAHMNEFNKLRYEVPILIRQTMIDLAVRCGLSFDEGWQFPFTIRFVDGAPFGVENILAYVRMGQTNKGDLVQELCVNLTAYERDKFNFDKVFSHELVHAMLNDSLGENSMELPTWFHEGLAVYGANQGEQMMNVYVSQRGDGASSLINGLEGSHSAADYLEDYLAFKYIHAEHGVNSLHNLIREVTKRKGDIPGAIDYTCNESWSEFQQNARKFAEGEIERITRSLRLQPLHSERDTKAY